MPMYRRRRDDVVIDSINNNVSSKMAICAYNTYRGFYM